jgi:prophage tail gpP-like protein
MLSMSRIIVKNATTGRELLWRHVNIKKSLDNICHTLELEIPSSERAKVHRHEKIEVRYENALVKDSGGKRRVTTVLVDEVAASAGIEKHAVLVTGRSPARDIIDSAWSDALTGQTLYQITKSICGKFGIDCVIIPTDKGDITSKVRVFMWQNESPWTKLITEADSQESGGRVFCLPQTRPAASISGRRRRQCAGRGSALPKGKTSKASSGGRTGPNNTMNIS